MHYLMDYQTFDTKHELNDAISAHLDRCSFDLNETDRDVFLMLSRYAVKYPGAAHLKVETIAIIVKKSARTIQRSLRKLERLNIIEARPFMRKVTGGFGARIYVILPSSVASDVSPRGLVVEPTQSKPEAVEVAIEPITLSSNNPAHTFDTKRGLRDKMPAFIYDTLSPYLNADDLFTAYGALLRGKSAIDRTIAFEANEGLFTDAIKSVINAYKRGAIRSIPAVLFTAIRDTTAQIYRKGNYTVPDWLSIATH